MVSRLVLTFQYGTILWHIRHFRQGQYPIAIIAAFHFVAAMVYLGISFRFEDGKSSRVHIVWYVMAGCEAMLNMGLSLNYKVLSFNGTHLTERMTTLTLIILGEGAAAVVDTVVVIVKNEGWSKFLLHWKKHCR